MFTKHQPEPLLSELVEHDMLRKQDRLAQTKAKRLMEKLINHREKRMGWIAKRVAEIITVNRFINRLNQIHAGRDLDGLLDLEVEVMNFANKTRTGDL